MKSPPGVLFVYMQDYYRRGLEKNKDLRLYYNIRIKGHLEELLNNFSIDEIASGIKSCGPSVQKLATLIVVSELARRNQRR